MLKGKKVLLLKVVEESGPVSRLRLVKLMFLLSRNERLRRCTPVYDFVPYKLGPFSFELYNDLRILSEKGAVTETDNNLIYGSMQLNRMETRVENEIRSLLQGLKDVDDRKLMLDIYDLYPDFTIFSEVDRRQHYIRDETGIITIGYEGLTIDSFIFKLLQHRVHRVVDVRKNPVSRRYGLSRTKLEETLAKFDIEYSHMPGLGIDSKERRGLVTLKDYQALFKRYRGWIGEDNPLIEEIMAMGREQKIALMCFERDSNYCHRGVIAEMIRARGCEVISV